MNLCVVLSLSMQDPTSSIGPSPAALLELAALHLLESNLCSDFHSSTNSHVIAKEYSLTLPYSRPRQPEQGLATAAMPKMTGLPSQQTPGSTTYSAEASHPSLGGMERPCPPLEVRPRCFACNSPVKVTDAWKVSRRSKHVAGCHPPQILQHRK